MCQTNQDTIKEAAESIRTLMNGENLETDVIRCLETIETESQEMLNGYEEELDNVSNLERQLEDALFDEKELENKVKKLEAEVEAFKVSDLGEEYQLKDLMDTVRPMLGAYEFEAKLASIKAILKGN